MLHGGLPKCQKNSAALIAMPDSIGSTIPTAQVRTISQRPNEPVLDSLGKNLITLSADCHSDIHRSSLKFAVLH
jgi:hypothetical protein